MIEHACDLHPVDDHNLIGENADAGARDRINILCGRVKLLVIARRKINAAGRGELFEWRQQAVKLALCAIEEVAGEKDKIRIDAGGQGCHAPAESDAVNAAQMEVAEKNGPAATPGRGQVGKMDPYAVNANDADIDQAIECMPRAARA